MEKDLLDLFKERIAAEARQGDLAGAARRTKVSTTTYYTAIRKARYCDLTDRERDLIDAYMDVLNTRRAEISKKIQKYQNEDN